MYFPIMALIENTAYTQSKTTRLLTASQQLRWPGDEIPVLDPWKVVPVLQPISCKFWFNTASLLQNSQPLT